MNYWVLGFLWGSARFSGEYLLVQSRHREWVEKVRNEIVPDRKVFSVEAHGRISWRVKIPIKHEYVCWMLANGYEGRIGNEERDMPAFSDPRDEADFFRGYFAPHHSIDYWTNRGVKKPRLRFYAALPILERLNEHFSREIGVGMKKPQGHNRSNVCKVLYFQSAVEIEKICEYLKLPRPND